jgi:hypothetical protein
MVALFYRLGRRESPDAIEPPQFFALDMRATVQSANRHAWGVEPKGGSIRLFSHNAEELMPPRGGDIAF